MNQGFRWKFDQMQENNPAQPAPGDAHDWDEVHYPGRGHVRNLNFVWPDGRQMFLNYSYLVAGEYHQEQSQIILAFTTHIVTLSGVNLTQLFTELMQQLPKHVICVDERYLATQEPNKSVVTKIEVRSNSE